MVVQQQEKYIAGFFSFGHRTTTTYLPGTGEATEVAIIIPRTGTLRNLSWDCQSNGLTGANNRFTIRVGALHASPNASAPALTDALVVSLDGGITSGTGVPMNCEVRAGQRVAVFVQARGGTNISRLRVSFELEAERDSVVWQPLDLVTSMLTPAGVSARAMNTGKLATNDYYFRVAASDGTNWTKASDELCFNLPEGSFGVRLSWSPVFMATKYRVYKACLVNGAYMYKYIETSETSYDYVDDSVFTVSTPPETTTAYINKLAAEGASWIMGGNVGVGTTIPQAKLDVHGSIKITDGSEGPGKILTSDEKGNATWTFLPTLGQTLKHDGIGWQTEQAQNQGQKVRENGYVIYSGSAGISYFGGNVGIGTSTPQAKLDVNGPIKITDGTEGAGKILASDAAGAASWQNLVTVPVGAIVAWHPHIPGTPRLPDGWVECNGQTLNDPASTYHNQVIPDLNSSGRFLRGSSKSGVMQEDALQAHKHAEPGHGHAVACSAHGVGQGGYGDYVTHYGGGSPIHTNSVAVQLGDPVDSGTGAGVPRTGNETRPVNMSVVWIIRIK
ncbi:MAG: HepHag family protein [Bacteroidetes bacterium]|nr:MAG: HepHag family protein [Bacteroidota bacterium]